MRETEGKLLISGKKREEGAGEGEREGERESARDRERQRKKNFF